MKKFKNLDRLFQEKFRDFEQAPPPDIWNNIQAELAGKPQEKKRALWWWFGSVAAGLLLLFTLYNTGSTTHSTPVEKTKTDVVTEDPIELSTTPEHTVTPKQNIDNTNIQQNNAYKNTITLSNTNTKTNKETNRIQPSHNRNSGFHNRDTDIADRVSIAKDKTESDEKINRYTKDETHLQKDASKSVAGKETPKQHMNKSENPVNNYPDNKAKSDALALLSKNNKTQKTRKRHAGRWSVTPQVAPVFFSSFEQNGASLDDKTAMNSAQGQVSTSYGVQLAYELTDRMTIQAGINKVDYAYRIDDLYVSPDVYADSRHEISMKDVINTHQIPYAMSYSLNQSYQETGKQIDSGNIVQIFGYYEVPVALKYDMIKTNRYSVRMLGGASALIKNSEEMYYQKDVVSKKVQGDSPVNTLSLTGNAGLEFSYRISRHINISLSPQFKIYAGKLKKDIQNFTPYTVGVYSGLNYRF